MKTKDLTIEKGDRTDKWIKAAKNGETTLPYVLNKTEAMIESELREKVKILLTAYREADYVKSRFNSNLKRART